MVVKLAKCSIYKTDKFESSVISYGSEAIRTCSAMMIWFESSVISYGSEAPIH